MTVKKTVSVRWLKEVGACIRQRRRFQELFGTEAVVSRTNVRLALKGKLRVYWIMLCPKFEEERNAYHRIQATAPNPEVCGWDQYQKLSDEALVTALCGPAPKRKIRPVQKHTRKAPNRKPTKRKRKR